jgi:hypothetical protein
MQKKKRTINNRKEQQSRPTDRQTDRQQTDSRQTDRQTVDRKTAELQKRAHRVSVRALRDPDKTESHNSTCSYNKTTG